MAHRFCQVLITEQIDLIATRSACGFLLLLCDEVFSDKGGEMNSGLFVYLWTDDSRGFRIR